MSGCAKRKNRLGEETLQEKFPFRKLIDRTHWLLTPSISQNAAVTYHMRLPSPLEQNPKMFLMEAGTLELFSQIEFHFSFIVYSFREKMW